MAKNPMYSDYLQYAPTFRWGGREWGEGDLAAFMKKIGGPKKYDKWARKHRVAAKSFDATEGAIYSQVQPVFTGIDAERKKRADYYQRLMKNLGGFTTAVMGQLGAIGPAIGGAYSEAANTMGAAGTGYGGLLNRDLSANAAAGNQTLNAIGAPEGQQLQGGDAGGVLAGLAGWIPKTLLNTQGGAWAEAAGQLPKSASIESQYMMKEILDKALEEEGDYDTQITEMLQKIPGLRSELKSDLTAASLKKQEFALKKLEAKRDWYLDQAKLALAAGDKARSNAYLKLAQQQEARMSASSAGYNAYGGAEKGYHIDPTTGAPIKDGWKIGKNGVPVKVGGGKSASTSSTVPGTPAYNAGALKAVGKARKDIDSYIKKTLVRKPTGAEVAAGADPTVTITPKWAEAYKTLHDAYKYLAVNPATKKRLDAVIRAALAAAGIKPGKGPMGPPAPPGTTKVP